jgi:hypothetical protein
VIAEDYSFAIQWTKTAPVDGGVGEAVPDKVREDRLKNEMTYWGISIKISSDTPSRHHLPFDRLTALSKPKGGVAFDRSSRSTLRLSTGLRRIAPYASVVAPRRLAPNTLLVIRNTP